MKAKISKSCLKGSVRVPGSKSHTIRAVLISTMASGVSNIQNPLTSEDCLSALRVAKLFGAKCEERDGMWVVEGTGGALTLPNDVVDCGNSGTTTYISTALAATIEGTTIITGDEQIRKRPIETLLKTLREAGADAYTSRPGVDAPPIVIGGKMKPGTVTIDGKISPQVSGLILASSLIDGDMTINVTTPMETPYIDMTIDWMKKYGASVTVNADYSEYKVSGVQQYTAQDSLIPSDWSGVLFPLVAGVITDSEIIIDGLDFNDLQGDKEVVNHLIAMGADIKKDEAGGRLLVKGGKPLKGIAMDLKNTPDALPALCVVAAYATGKTTFTGLEVVRMKETDRVAVMAEEMTKMGVDITYDDHSLVVNGNGKMNGSEVESHDDHRVAMALMVAGFITETPQTVHEVECANVSYPRFIENMRAIGAHIETV